MESYRIDKMRNTSITHTDAAPVPIDFNIDNYSSRIFDMVSGDSETVQLICKSNAMDALIDRFGRDFHSERIDEDRFTANVTVDVSPAFYSWVFQFGGDVRIAGPGDVRNNFEAMLRRQLLAL